MPGAEVERFPQWPLRLVLPVLFVVESFLVLRLSVEGVTENIMMIVHSPSDHRFIGTLIIAVFYVAVGLLIASPLRLSSKRATT